MTYTFSHLSLNYEIDCREQSGMRFVNNNKHLTFLMKRDKKKLNFSTKTKPLDFLSLQYVLRFSFIGLVCEN